MRSSSTDKFLKVMKFFVFWADGSDQPQALNRAAEEFFSTINFGAGAYRDLFGVDGFEQLAELATSGRKREFTTHLKGGRSKVLRWEFVQSGAGILCIAVDWESIEKLVESVKNESLLYKEVLLNILPGSVAEELVAKKAVHPKVYRHCTILFTDVVRFSQLTFHMDPVSLIRRLNDYFSSYDEIMEDFGVEKIKTIGDSYMCVSGIPVKKPSHSVDMCLAALGIRDLMGKKTKPDFTANDLDLNNWEIRIGIHTGPAISGVVGFKKYTFDIWGDSVNIAAGMEGAGEAGRIHISKSTYEEVKEFFRCEFRGKREIHNVGPMDTFFLEGIKGDFSHDGQGIRPNEKFCKSYFDKFAKGTPGSTLERFPNFMKEFLRKTGDLKSGEASGRKAV